MTSSQVQRQRSSNDVAPEVRAYLQRAGWFPTTRGEAGELWSHDGADHPIAVPYRLVQGGVEWLSVAERLAAFENVAVAAVERALAHAYVDVTRLRAANDIVIAGTIPLAVGTALVTSAAAMVRAAATTAQRLKGDIGGGFSKIGDAIAAEARLAHTEQGSYIVPVLLPLSPPPEALPGRSAQGEIKGVEATRSAYEPAERRVSRTLATALAALQQNIVQPAKAVTTRTLHPFVDAGGSRELVVAVSRILDQDAVAEFEASFEWASGVEAPVALPATVKVDSEANELLKKAARLLREDRYSPAQILSGPIVEVRHAPDDPFGEIAIQTVYRRRACEVRLRVTAAEVDEANGWMRAKRAVLAEGEIRSARGRPLMIAKPVRLMPLDETMLPASQE